MSERSEIVKPLYDALLQLGCMPLRMNSGSPSHRMRGHTKGTPDLLVLPRDAAGFSVGGRNYAYAWVEAKGSHPDACKCKSCEAQHKMRVTLIARGGLYLKVRSVVEALVGLGLVQVAKDRAVLAAPLLGKVGG